MASVVVQRLPRRPAPEIPAGELPVAAPPEIPQSTVGRAALLLMTLPLLTGTLATALMFAGRDGGPYSYVVGALFGVSSLAMLATSWGSHSGTPRRAELFQQRREYLRHLANLRRRARETARRQRDGLFYRHPDPDRLWSTVDSFRLWERRPADPDFGVVRVAVGPQTLATPLRPAVTRPPEDLEPMTAGALRRFLDAYSVVPDLPVAVSLRGFARVHVHGDEQRRYGLVRALIAQLVTFHAPDDLLIAVCAGARQQPAWEWLKWLPHAQHPTQADALGPRRLVAATATELALPPGPHVVLVLDGGDLGGDPGSDLGSDLGSHDVRDGVTLIDLDGPPPRLLDPFSLVLAVHGSRLLTRTADQDADVGTPDALTEIEAEALARRLAPRRLATTAGAAATDLGLADLLGLGDPYGYDPWPPRAEKDRLRVPIGVGPDGQPVVLDLKESAQDGMGPHGLLIGATGSGKSELLRTLVLGLAATHSSEELNLVLVDFKGGATFASLDRLPHTAALITNLADELPLVDRMTQALSGELTRRQELLRRAGNLASRRDYEHARAGGAALAPLPVLLVVVDEFSELLSAKPDFIDLFVQIGRLGRSLGVHLLLASQRLDEGRLRGLDTHLSYRIGLRTFSALESRAVLGAPDAYELPRSPGHGYLRYGTEPLVRFRAAYVSGGYRRPAPVTADQVRRFGTTAVAAAPRPVAGGSLLDILVDRLTGQGPPAHQVWLPALSSPPALTDLLGPLTVDPARGLTVGNPELRGALSVPVAVVDKPYEQRRDPLWLDLRGATGHLAVVGGPRSGKSTVLRSLVTALALTHTPAEVHVYCLDFGGGTLGRLRSLPHVGGVAGRLEPEVVRRTVGEVTAVLAARERGERTTLLGEPATSQVFLFVDGWATLRADYEDLEPAVTDIAARGLSYGIHLVASAARWMDLRPAVRDLFGSRIELRLGDPSDSAVNRRAALDVPDRSPGRGITPDGAHLLTASPEQSTVEAIGAAWTGPRAPAVRLLPAVVPYAYVDGAGLDLPIGLAETDLGPVAVDFAAEPHLLLFGDAGCGKSSFLRALATTITRRCTPEEARIVLVDYRRGLLGVAGDDHLIGYATASAPALELIGSVADYMQRRLPERTGPDCFVLVDDYDLVAVGPANPLLPLLDHLAHARDTGLHLVLARRSGGAGRALYEPVIQRLRELSTTGLVMSGDREEGALVGTVRPGPLPPGRGWLVTRRDGVQLVQLAYLAPPPSGG